MTRTPVAILISGSGTNMAALLYASRAGNCPYEIVLVASNNPDAAGLRLAAAEGVPTFVLPHKGMARRRAVARRHRCAVGCGRAR